LPRSGKAWTYFYRMSGTKINSAAIIATKRHKMHKKLTPKDAINAGVWLLTPKALANFSPGFERSENPGNPNY